MRKICDINQNPSANPNTDDQKWIRVCTRKNKHRRSSNMGPTRENRIPFKTIDFDDIEEDEWHILVKKFAYIRSDLSKTEFFKSLLSVIHDSFNSICPNNDLPLNILCLGLGNPSTNRSSLRQLALLDLLVESFENLDRSNVSLYDPMFRSVSRHLIDHLKMKIITCNKEGAYDLDKQSYHFIMMPHCVPLLLNNLFGANWNSQIIRRMVLYANQWTKMKYEWSVIAPNPTLVNKLDYIWRLDPALEIPNAQRYLTQSKQKNYELEEVQDFEGMRVQYFDEHKLESLSNLIWHNPIIENTIGVNPNSLEFDLIPQSVISCFVDNKSKDMEVNQ